jgi:mono/diheme cytochrome c family protein
MNIRNRIGAITGIVLVAAIAGAIQGRADMARGQALAKQWCSQCHGIGPSESSLTPKIPSFSEIAAEPSVTEPSLRVFLRTSHSTMPNLILNQDDTDDIVSYILSLKPAR